MAGVAEGELLWVPPRSWVAKSNLARYMDWLEAHRGQSFKQDYQKLWQWSVDDIEAFWASLWDYFQIESAVPYTRVIDRHVMPGARWFEGSLLNYAEHLLRHEAKAKPDEVAIHHLTERSPLQQMSWQELGRQVRIVATQLRQLGVEPGDRVVSYMPNVPQTSVAMIATIAIGAVWSSAAPEFGTKTVTERFAQIAPKVLFAADGYTFGGKTFDRVREVTEILAGLPSIEQVIWLPILRDGAQACPFSATALGWSALLDHADVSGDEFRFERVPHDHPLWILFSSGTTGLPKAIVHSHVGALMEQYKLLAFHLNLSPGSVMFFYTTTGWVMYNMLIAALLTGSAIVQYDGSPVHPDIDFLWKLAADTRTTNFGASPTFVQMMEKAGLKPGEKYDLSAMESVLVAGSPSTPETFKWFYDCVKPSLWVTSQSGGTEICSAFVGASPTLPVRAGEIQTRLLGMDIRSWSDDGKDLTDQVGELVCTQPFPSMPLRFWNDDDGQRYHDAYFGVFDGIWRHGDFIKITRDGGCYIYGRSDSTLNRHGVRIGTSEIYRAVEQVEEVADSLVVCCELAKGKFFMPLFVKLKPGFEGSEELVTKIATKLRADCSPRHVPDRTYFVQDIPYTLTGKKLEVPVRKILMGWPVEKAASRDATSNPKAIDWYVDFAETTRDYERPASPFGGVGAL